MLASGFRIPWATAATRYKPVCKRRHSAKPHHNCSLLNRNEFATTLTDDKAMAAAATAGDRRMPVTG